MMLARLDAPQRGSPQKVRDKPGKGLHPPGMTFDDSKTQVCGQSGPAMNYGMLHEELAGLLQGERDWLANLANTAALLHLRLRDLNWVGFYLWRSGELVLGPFQGKPACVRIARGRGVCGTAAARCETLVVPDVHEFPGHIACDPASASEIVVPMESGGRQFGVLDLDSPRTGRFNDTDRCGLEAVVRMLLQSTDWPGDIGEASGGI
jgi:GAF domain-containing protein